MTGRTVIGRASPAGTGPRRITGMSAVLLPFDESGGIDWSGFEAHLVRTSAAGLVPAVNMDTGFGPLLSGAQRARGAGTHPFAHGGAGGPTDSSRGDRRRRTR
ncbi:MAG: hypothetical protein R2716_07360 [Microthrixaceae bacterium]